MSTRHRVTLALLALACSAGCVHRVPPVAGDLLLYRRTDPLGGTTIRAEGVTVTDTEVRADRATWNTTYPWFSLDLQVENYARPRAAAPLKP